MNKVKSEWLVDSRWKITHHSPYMKKSWVDDLSNFLQTDYIYDYSIREEFEKKIADYCGCKYSIAVNSGTSAIMIVMFCLGLKKIVGPDYGNIAWFNCSNLLGIKSKRIDVSLSTFCLDPIQLEGELSKEKYDAVVYINHGGYVGEELENISNICKEKNVILIEDSCNSLGQWYKGKHAGTFGDFGFLSFGLPKLITCGEGGAILLNDYSIYKKCKEFVYQGGWYDHPVHTKLSIGANFVMSIPNSYFLSKQLDDVDELLRMRDNVCSMYENKNIKVKRFSNSPSSFEYENTNAEKISKVSRSMGVQIIHKNYITPINEFKNPNADYIKNNTVLLPDSIKLTKKDIDYISAAIKIGGR